MKKIIEYTFYIIVSMFICISFSNPMDKFESKQIKEITNLSISYSKNDTSGIKEHTKEAYKNPINKIDNLPVN